MRRRFVVLWMLVFAVTSASAEVSVAIGLPGVSIGINLPRYPELVPVPGYPVYYAPRVNSNYFFYDGMYWIYQRDSWYASSWYDGPWTLVTPEAVPLYVLRVPVRYYRRPPTYFSGWRSDAPPRWGEHWGNAWEQRRHGWDTWNRTSVPTPAPLPSYQRQYSGNRYPRVEQQQALQSQNYRYQPRDAVVQENHQAQPMQKAPTAPLEARQRGSQERISAPDYQRGTGRPTSLQQATPPASHGSLPQVRGENVRKPAEAQPVRTVAIVQPPRQQLQKGVAQHEPQSPRPQTLDKAPEARGRADVSKQDHHKRED